ncbi:hypothetical protein GCM10027059_49340 [Myceligenerans halotolerans]
MTEREKTPAGESVPVDVGRIMRIATEIVAPVTLVTALLYFFGRKQMTFFYDYFGVEISSLGLTTTDYLLLAQDGLLIPLAVVAMGVLVTLWVRDGARVFGTRPDIETWVMRVAASLGGLLTLFGLIQALWPGIGLAGWVPTWIAPLCLAGGVLLLDLAVRRWQVRRQRDDASWVPPSETARLAEWGAAFVLVAVSLFWAAADYSAAVGQARAHQFVHDLPTYSSVVVRSSTDLQIVEPGVTTAVCSTDESGFRYRYDGLVLMVASGGQYVLIPRTWSRDTSSVVSIPTTDGVRLDHLSPSPEHQARQGPTSEPGGPC